MARHIMAVCVVCLLCADHLPCKQHDDDPLGTSSGKATIGPIYHNDFRRIEDSAVALEKSQPTKRHTHDDHSHQHHHHGDGHGDDHDGDDGEEAERREKLDSFMQRIFKEFGDAGTMTMDVGGFEAMVKRLNMYRLVTEELGSSRGVPPAGVAIGHEHSDEGECINSIDFVQHVAVPKPEVSLVPAGNLSQSSPSSVAANSNSSSSSTVSPSDKLSNKSASSAGNGTTTNGTSAPSELDRLKASIRLNRNDLFNICPILLAQLASKTSRERAGCIDPASVPDLRDLEASLGVGHDGHDHAGGDAIELTVWIYSTLAILGVSLCGLLGVAVIPCMDKHFYQHALQFLVALAVGTLCGDALLHLLPHAMMGSGSHFSHDDMMYKGLAAVSGIVFFYFMERFLTVVAEWYKHEEKKDKPSSRVRVLRDPESSSNHPAASGASDKQCKHKYSSYPYCYDEIAMDTKDDHHEHNHVENNHHHNNHNNALAKCANHDADHHSEYASLQTNGKPLTVEDTLGQQDNTTVSTNLDASSIESDQTHKPTHNNKSTRPAENYTIILREHETKHHGHSHTHGHVHSPPGSLSAVAWMVIMGDGLHNFTDGMTIGAAFANNIAGGFSTAIAVFCHELPHELGDFAVLLKAGMSARDAVYYNLLSSILSFIGMLIGIVIGHQPEASAWVFAVAAGLFLYIALVDMIPELTSAHGAEDRCKTSEFLLQFFGMSAGFGIMLLIAMYEHDLKEMFMD
uniref:Zinc transporter foi n=1 Tax=Culex pipiens TaxID=7175 RepID=A0A8D8GVT5_CULPI